MIDINLIRDEKSRKTVIESEEKRFKDTSLVTEVYQLDIQRTEKQREFERENMKVNSLQREIKEMKKNKTETKELFDTNIKEQQEHKARSVELLAVVKSLETEIYKKLSTIGNILDDDVVFSKDETNNKLVRSYKSDRPILANLPYDVLFDKIGGVDLVRGAKLVGHRGYFILEELALLKSAIASYAIDFARERGYKLIQTPVFIKKTEMAKTAQLSDFDEQLYKVEDEMYLIATSEQPLSLMHSGERISNQELPIKYVGESLCFRKEAGAHGKDNKGLFRIHQFDKIEQFVLCAPKDSKELFESMISLSEDFYRSLDISYNVVSIVSGEMNDSAAIKYDLEAFFPETKRFRELVSCSNCTDYQSRNAEIRFGFSEGNSYVHMLNCTLVAVQRAMCCIVENYQDPTGIIIPEVLKPYFKRSHISFKC